MLTGRSARKTTWPEIDEFLAANDPVEPKPKRAGVRAFASSATMLGSAPAA